MRTITGQMASELAKQYASKPRVILEILWSTGSVFYSDLTFTLGTTPVKGVFLEQPVLSETQKTVSSMTVNTASFSLDDTSGELRTIFRNLNMNNTNCKVYQYYDGLALSDLLLLLSGVIVNPIWDEGERTLSFSVETLTRDRDLLRYYQDTDAVLPLCFGTPINVPVQIIKEPNTGTTKEIITSNTTTFGVNDGGKFNTGNILIDNTVAYSGAFNGDIFTGTITHLGQVTLASSITLGPNTYIEYPAIWTSPGGKVPDNANAYWFYCPAAGQTVYGAVFGSTIKFFPTKVPTTISGTLYFAKVAPRNWPNNESIQWRSVNDTRVGWGYIWPVGDFVIQSGAAVRTILSTPQIQYIVNGSSSYAIKGVSAMKDGVMTQVSSSYFSIDLGEPTILTFPIELSKRTYIDQGEEKNEGWSDELFVTVSSGKSNVIDALKYIIDIYTDYDYDASFDNVRTEMEKFPVNFAYTSQIDAIKAIEEICYQSRLGLKFNGQTFSVVYLATIPASVCTLNESNTLMKTLSLGLSSDNIYQLTGTWRPDLQSEKRNLIYRNGTGLYKDNIDIYIYNTESLVRKTLWFWGYRKTNNWQKLSLTTFIENLPLEVFDGITANHAVVGTNWLGTIETTTKENDTYKLGTTLAIKAGETTVDPGVFPGTNGSTAVPEDDRGTINGVPADTNGSPGYGTPDDSFVAPEDPSSGISLVTYPDPTSTASPIYYLKVSSCPAIFVRGETKLVTYQLVDQNGAKVNTDINVPISFLPADLRDEILDNSSDPISSVSIVEGEISLLTKFNGGAGSNDNNVIVLPDVGDYVGTTSTAFSIVDTALHLVFTTLPPASMEKGTTFDLAIEVWDDTNTIVPLTQQAQLKFSSTSSSDWLKDTVGDELFVVDLVNGRWQGTVSIEGDDVSSTALLYAISVNISNSLTYKMQLGGTTVLDNGHVSEELVLHNANNIVTDSSTVTEEVEKYFLLPYFTLTFKPFINRNTNYTVTITAHHANGIVDTSYNTDTPLRFESTDPNDTITPTSTGTGWTAGTKTFNLRVDNGAVTAIITSLTIENWYTFVVASLTSFTTPYIIDTTLCFYSDTLSNADRYVAIGSGVSAMLARAIPAIGHLGVDDYSYNPISSKYYVNFRCGYSKFASSPGTIYPTIKNGKINSLYYIYYNTFDSNELTGTLNLFFTQDVSTLNGYSIYALTPDMKVSYHDSIYTSNLGLTEEVIDKVKSFNTSINHYYVVMWLDGFGELGNHETNLTKTIRFLPNYQPTITFYY